MTHLALRLEVSLDKHVEVLANGVLVGVPELDVLQQRQRHGVVGDREAQLHGACQVLHCHGCVEQHKTVEGPESLACIWHVVILLVLCNGRVPLGYCKAAHDLEERYT